MNRLRNAYTQIAKAEEQAVKVQEWAVDMHEWWQMTIHCLEETTHANAELKES